MEQFWKKAAGKKVGHPFTETVKANFLG